jgi:peptidoglycan/LPS O-acetylase OafA/YrhL
VRFAVLESFRGLCMLLVVILFSKYSYKYIEVPFNNLGRRISVRKIELPCHR